MRAVVVDQRARARHRHRRARRVGDGRLSRHDCGDLAARRTRGAARQPVGGGDGRVAARRSTSSSSATRRISSTRRPSTRSSTPTTCTSCSTTSSAPPSSCRSRPASGSAARTCSRCWRCWPRTASCTSAGEGDQAQWHWTSESYPADAVSLRSVSSDNFVIVDITERRRGSSARPTSPAARRRFTRRRSTSSRASCSRSSSSTSTTGRRSSARWTATTTPTRSRYDASRPRHLQERGGAGRAARARGTLARRGARGVARRRVQEDQVLHQ